MVSTNDISDRIRLIVPQIGEQEIDAVADVLRSGYLVQGQQVAAFEQSVADYIGVKHAIAVTSGTAALHLAVAALGLGEGDEVIVPDFTWPATGNVVEICGAKAVLVDIDLDTFNINIEAARQAMTPRTKAIIPVHLFGLSADMAPIMELAKQHNLRIIEDGACALGATYQQQFCGTFGEIGCFSFHPRKSITTGEGGMLTTQDDALAAKLRSLRNHGIDYAPDGAAFLYAGYNYRLTDIQGAIGVVQMQKLTQILNVRQQLAEQYHQALQGIDWLTLPSTPNGSTHTWQSYITLVDPAKDRAAVMQALSAARIENNIGTYALHVQPYYQKYDVHAPNSRIAFEQALCLPLNHNMTQADIQRVARVLGSL